jgi:hypothetical protein
MRGASEDEIARRILDFVVGIPVFGRDGDDRAFHGSVGTSRQAIGAQVVPEQQWITLVRTSLLADRTYLWGDSVSRGCFSLRCWRVGPEAVSMAGPLAPSRRDRSEAEAVDSGEDRRMLWRRGTSPDLHLMGVLLVRCVRGFGVRGRP